MPGFSPSRDEYFAMKHDLERQMSIANHYVNECEKLREAVKVLGKCGSCGGSGVYTNRGIKDEGSGPKVIKGKVYNEQVQCRKCDGTGMSKIARDALGEP